MSTERQFVAYLESFATTVGPEQLDDHKRAKLHPQIAPGDSVVDTGGEIRFQGWR